MLSGFGSASRTPPRWAEMSQISHRSGEFDKPPLPILTIRLGNSSPISRSRDPPRMTVSGDSEFLKTSPVFPQKRGCSQTTI